MTFIQCKDEEDVARRLDKLKAGFVTSDHRIYDEIACVCHLNHKTSIRFYMRKEDIINHCMKLKKAAGE